MTTETKTGKCKFCGSPYHRGWQCKDNPKVIARLAAAKQKSYTASLSPRTAKKSVKRGNGQVRSKLIRDYDNLFSKYLRKKAELEGSLFCFTCGKRLTYDNAVVMHFIGRRFIGVRFDEDNVHVGCRKCNTPDINQPEVLRRYASLLGQDVVEELNRKKNMKISTPELQANYDHLKEKYKSICLLS